VAEFNGVGWGITEDDKDEFGLRKRYVITDGEWRSCPDDLWDVIVAGLDATGEKLEEG
jgi:hypothetical protein